MNKRTLVLGLGLLVMLVLATTATAARAEHEHGHGAVYTLTNSPLGNAVAAFERSADGTLAPAGLIPTGGAGTGSNLGSQGAVVLSDDQKELYAVNAGSNTISFFSVSRDGLDLEGTVPSGRDSADQRHRAQGRALRPERGWHGEHHRLQHRR